MFSSAIKYACKAAIVVTIAAGPHYFRSIKTAIGSIFKQVAQLSQRDRAAGWVSNGEKWKTGTEIQYLRTI